MVHRLDGLNLLENFHRLTFPKIISSGNTYAFDFSNITPFYVQSNTKSVYNIHGAMLPETLGF